MKFLILLLIAALVFTALWFNYGHNLQSGVAHEFHQKLERAKNESIDLRNFSPVEWDEIVYWKPMTDVCDYEIEGFEKDSDSCLMIRNQNESYLLLLNRSKLVARIPINRKKIDFSIDQRIPKDQAIFRFESQSTPKKLSWISPEESAPLENK